MFFVSLGDVVLIAVAAVAGMTSVVFYLAWARRFVALDRRSLVRLAAWCFLISEVLDFLGSAIGPTVEGVLACVCLVVQCAVLLTGFEAGEAAAPASTLGGAPAGNARPAFVRALIALAVSMFSMGVASTFSQATVSRYDEALEWYALPHIALVVAMVGLLVDLIAYSTRTKRVSLDIGVVFKTGLLFAVLALVLLVGLGVYTVPSVAYVAAGLCQSLVEMCAWILLVDISLRGARPVLWTVAIGRLVMGLSLVVGMVVADVFMESAVWILLVCMLGIAAVGFFCFEGEMPRLVFDIDAPAGEGEGVGDGGADGAGLASGGLAEGDEGEGLSLSLSDARVAEFERAHHLTARECEIFEQWITSHGIRQIQETFGLSQTTVKTHVRHIYTKCGVHSRRELVELFETSER